MRNHPSVTLRAYGLQPVADLEFLQHFPFLRRFWVDVFELRSLAGLRYLPDDLELLAIGQTRTTRFSLKPLERFASLRRLSLEAQRKDIAALATLRELRDLTLRSITLDDLSLLKPLTQLRSLSIKLGGTTDLSLVPEIGRIEYFEVWMVRGLHDLGMIDRMDHLEHLFLQTLKHVKRLPSLGPLKRLLRVQLMTMKGLTDMRPIADAPNLEDLMVLDMPQLTVEHLRPFVDHPSLKHALVGLGSRKKDQQVKNMLPSPQVVD